MFINANTLPTNEILETEICIVGTGPAGITLAREFIGQDFRVIVLESGSLEFDETTQSLYDGVIGCNSAFLPYHSRRRQFGGTANTWGIKVGNEQLWVRYVPLDEIDFEKRDWLPYSGWPFSKADLDPFYERAHAVCQIGAFDYSVTAWGEAQNPQLPFQEERVTTTMFQCGSRENFLQEYREKIKRATNITAYLNANVVDIETLETANTVTRVRVATLGGIQFWVKAKIFILATGGIENARLLLLANQSQKNGLGNQNDLVGRFFMDHYQVSCGVLLPADCKMFNQTALYDIRQVGQVPVMGKLSLTQDVLRREQLLNMATYLLPRHKTYHLRMGAIHSYQILLAALRLGKLPQEPLSHLYNLIAGMKHLANAVHRRVVIRKPFVHPQVSGGGWSTLPNKEQEFAEFEIQHLIEQAPNPNNRVTLSQERDRLGCRKVQVDCRLSEIDLYSIKRTQAILREEFARSGLGQLQVGPGESPTILTPSGSAHHIGTTRMHVDPKQGVVDAHGKVHGISNLFIAGSSVFPTGGYANPTLTIIALAIRLADQIKMIISI